MRKALVAIAGLAVTAAVVVGIIQAGATDGATGGPPQPLTRAEVTRPLAGAPPELAALRRRVNELTEGGTKALDAQLRALRGHPVVVNVWASWCEPCLFELPFLQRQAVQRGARVAFLGVNSGDNNGDARKMSARFPMPYPSFEDPRQNVAGRYRALGLPATAFYDATGKLVTVHQGGYRTEARLAADIDRYALG
ncbi:MAG TPA: TlpA disulfide reductase family protein [Solirubrobacteraceae bacterium]|nr:TlpA disulfide reductase family protein [Solirubrobacteraceae bacterium]